MTSQNSESLLQRGQFENSIIKSSANDLSKYAFSHFSHCFINIASEKFEKPNTYVPYGFLTSWTGRKAVREIPVFHLTNSKQATHYLPIF